MKSSIALLKALAFSCFIIVFIRCSSDNPADVYDPDPVQQDPDDPDPGPDPVSQDPVLADNVVSIEDAKSEVVSSEAELADGTYIVEFIDTPPTIEVNDIIVGGEGYGFIRRVIEISTEGNRVSMVTEQAHLNDVFISGKVEFTTDTSGSNRIGSGIRSNLGKKGETFKEELSFDLTHVDLGPYFTLTEGRASFDPNLGPIVVEYDGSQAREMSFKDNVIALTTELDFIIESAGAVDFANVDNMDPIVLEYPQEVLGLEFNLVITIEPVVDFGLFIDSAFKANGGITNVAEASLSAQNTNASWLSDDSYDVNTSSTSVYIEQPANVQQHFTFIVRLSAEVNLLPGIYLQADANEDFYVNYEDETGDWDSGLTAGFDINYGIYGEIFGFEYDLSEPPYSYSNLLWYAPANLMIESGDDQIGVYYGPTQTSPLEGPLKVFVFDSFGSPLENVFVHYRVITGGGSMEIPNVPTGAAGFAQNNWTLGSDSEEQVVEVTIKKANGDLIGDSPLEFHATMIDLSGVWVIVNTSSNCPEGVNYRFSIHPNGINILGEDTSEITSTSFEFDTDEGYMVIGITSEEKFTYICEVDELFYSTVETGVAVISGHYEDGEVTGSYSVSFTELPVNPCVYNFSCSDTFRMYKE